MSDKNLTQKNWSSWHHLLHKEILSNKTFIPEGSNILISVSGGQDSMTLLTIINDLRKLHNWSINVWHGASNTGNETGTDYESKSRPGLILGLRITHDRDRD